jgi:DNA invertase Pin-like site-specific DNA recombinase
MLIAYARASTHEQTLNLQKDALQKTGYTKIFTNTASGAKAERKGLEQALSYVRGGDTFVVWRLDRLGRSLPHLIATMTEGRWATSFVATLHPKCLSLRSGGAGDWI